MAYLSLYHMNPLACYNRRGVPPFRSTHAVIFKHSRERTANCCIRRWQLRLVIAATLSAYQTGRGSAWQIRENISRADHALTTRSRWRWSYMVASTCSRSGNQDHQDVLFPPISAPDFPVFWTWDPRWTCRVFPRAFHAAQDLGANFKEVFAEAIPFKICSFSPAKSTESFPGSPRICQFGVPRDRVESGKAGDSRRFLSLGCACQVPVAYRPWHFPAVGNASAEPAFFRLRTQHQQSKGDGLRAPGFCFWRVRMCVDVGPSFRACDEWPPARISL